jgi:hypothetical protein
MNRKTSALILALVLSVGCSNKAASDDAVSKAILQHLSTRPGLDMSKMDVEVSKVNVNGDKATVDVTFKVKGGAANQTMGMTYDLVRADGAWKVQGTPTGHGADAAATGASPHGAGGPPMGGDGGEKAGASSGFHPEVGGGAGGGTRGGGQMPPGHPPVNPPTGKQ